MSEDWKTRNSSFLKELTLFFAVLFFTCIVGIITLLPELEKINGFFSGLANSILYFGLLLGANYSVYKFFQFYKWNLDFAEKYGYGFYSIDVNYLLRFFKKVKYLQLFIIILMTFVFLVLYLVKLKILT